MTNHQAATILREYNDWRRHEGTPCPPPRSTNEIGEAIDLAIETLSRTIPLTIDGVTQAVCEATGITADEVMEHTRCREFSEARWMIWWIARKIIGRSLTAIARHFNCTHANVIHGINKGDDFMTNPLLNPKWVKRTNTIINNLMNQ